MPKLTQVEIVKELSDNYWESWVLEDHFKKKEQRTEFLWQAARDELLPADQSALQLLAEHPDGADAEATVKLLCEAPLDEEHRGVKGWDWSYEDLLEAVAKHDGHRLKEHYARLPDPIDDLAAIALLRRGLIKGLSQKTAGNLAVAYLEASYDDDFFTVIKKSKINASAWEELLLAQAAEPGHKVRLRAVEALMERATPEQLVGLIGNLDELFKVVGLGQQLLVPLGTAAVPLIEAALEQKAAARPDYVSAEEQALALALTEILIAAGQPLPPALDRQLVEAMASSGDEAALAPLRRALEHLDQARRDEVVRRGLSGSFSNPRGLQAVDLAINEATLAAVLQHALKVTENNYVAAGVIKAFGLLGPMAVAALTEALSAKPKPKNAHAELYVRALAEIGDAAAAPALVEALGHSAKGVRAAATKALEGFGPAAHAALSEGAKARKKAVRETCELLLSKADAPRDTPLHALRQKLEALPQREELVQTLASCTEWQQREERIVPLVKEHGALLLAAARDWFVKQADNYNVYGAWNHAVERLSDDADAAWVAVEAFAALPKLSSYTVHELRSTLQRFGPLSVEPILAALSGPPPVQRLDLYELLAAHRPDADPALWVRALGDSQKSVRDVAAGALQGLGPAAAPLVLPLLAQKKKAVRLAAAELLAETAGAEHAEALRAALKKEKAAEVAAALERALERGGAAVHELPAEGDDATIEAFLAGLAKRSKAPKWLDLGALPPLTLRSGAALSEPALLGLIARLKNEGPETQEALARQVRPLLDDDSAAAWSTALRSAWRKANSPSKEKWALYQQGILADEDQLNLAAPQLDWLVSSGMHHQAGWYIDVLARHGSVTASSWVAYWARNAEAESLQTRARERLDALAAAAGESLDLYVARLNPFIYDDVSDRSIPTLGFEAPVVLDYGARSFEARLGPGAALTLCSTEAKGKHYKSAPKAQKSDDADKAADARERFKQLRTALKRVVKQQTHRLQDAMVAGRPWSAPQFRALFVEHPVMRPLACGLVFRADSGALLRCTADGELVDVEYNQATLADDARLTLVHPLELEPELLKAWGQHLADAELLQPFPQFGRPTYAVSDGPQAYGEAKPVALAARLRDLGWRNARAEDAGMVYAAGRLLAGRGVRAEVQHGGFYIGDPSWGDEPISVEGLSFYDLEGQALTPEQVDPVAYSEVLYELQRVAPVR